MKRMGIRFTSAVNEESVNTLLDALEKHRKTTDVFSLLISSPGGDIASGITAYNYLCGLRVETETYNIGRVDSIAVVLFCAGKRRFAFPQTGFLIHSTQWSPTEKRYREMRLREQLDSLETDRRNIAGIVARTCGTPVKDIEDIMLRGQTISAEASKKLGLVTDIVSDITDSGMDMIGIGRRTR